MWRLVNGEDRNISESFKTVSSVFFIFYSIRLVVFAIMRRHVPDMGIL
jgi:hypothetical protein